MADLMWKISLMSRNISSEMNFRNDTSKTKHHADFNVVPKSHTPLLMIMYSGLYEQETSTTW